MKNKKLQYNRKILKNLKKIVSTVIFFNKRLRKDIIRDLNSRLNKLMLLEYSNKYPDDYIIFTRNGVGDVFFTASLLHEFKKNCPGKIIYLTDKPKLKSFIEAFTAIDEAITDKDTKLFQALSPIQDTIQKGKVNFLFFPYRGTKKNLVFKDSYANLLGVDISTKRELPQITPSTIINAENEFNRLNLSGSKTVILIPESVMFNYKVLPAKFWKTLADKLEKLGYDIVFNSSNKAYKSYKTTFLPVIDFISFSRKCNYIIAFRSGICDILTGCGIENITAIYPPNLEVIWADKFIFDNYLNKYHQPLFETELENIFHIYSLNSNFKTNNINEIIFDYNEKKLQERIIKQLTSTRKETKIKEWI